MNKVVMNINSIVEGEGVTPTHFGFMSFQQIKADTYFHVALKSKGIFD